MIASRLSVLPQSLVLALMISGYDIFLKTICVLNLGGLAPLGLQMPRTLVHVHGEQGSVLAPDKANYGSRPWYTTIARVLGVWQVLQNTIS